MYQKFIISCIFILLSACQQQGSEPAVLLTEFQCEGLETNQLSAHYELFEAHKSAVGEIGEPEQTSQLTLWRQGAQVMHQYQPPNISQFWALDQHQGIWHSQYFDDYQRAIEYEASRSDKQLETEKWSAYWQLISQSKLANMREVSRGGEACQAFVVLESEHAGQRQQLWWLTELALPARFEISQVAADESSSQILQRWQLTSLTSDKAQITQAFNLRSAYNATDFADIGDSEDDPFLASMIRLGFVEHGANGFYDAQGHNQTNAGHGH